MADCCLIKKVATVEVYENKNEVRAYNFMAGDKNTPMMEVKFKHLWGEENLSKCKLRWIIVDDLGSLLVGEVPIEQDNTASIQLPNELFTGERRMKVQLTVASCDGSRILNLQQFTDLKVINNLASNEVVEPVYQMLINQVYDDTKKYLAELETSYKAKYGSLESVYAKSKTSLEQYLINAENGGNAEFLQGYNPKNFNRVENTINELINSAGSKYKVGDVVEVLGYYTAGDGAHHKRKIESADDGSGVQLANGLRANIVHNGEVNVSWFGAKGDGVADDTGAIQKALDFVKYFKKAVTLKTSGLPKIKISKTIGLVYENYDYESMQGNKTTFDFGNSEIYTTKDFKGVVFEYGVKNTSGLSYLGLRHKTFKNISIRGVSPDITTCFHVFTKAEGFDAYATCLTSFVFDNIRISTESGNCMHIENGLFESSLDNIFLTKARAITTPFESKKEYPLKITRGGEVGYTQENLVTSLTIGTLTTWGGYNGILIEGSTPQAMNIKNANCFSTYAEAVRVVRARDSGLVFDYLHCEEFCLIEGKSAVSVEGGCTILNLTGQNTPAYGENAKCFVEYIPLELRSWSNFTNSWFSADSTLVVKKISKYLQGVLPKNSTHFYISKGDGSPATIVTEVRDVLFDSDIRNSTIITPFEKIYSTGGRAFNKKVKYSEVEGIDFMDVWQGKEVKAKYTAENIKSYSETEGTFKNNLTFNLEGSTQLPRIGFLGKGGLSVRTFDDTKTTEHQVMQLANILEAFGLLTKTMPTETLNMSNSIPYAGGVLEVSKNDKGETKYKHYTLRKQTFDLKRLNNPYCTLKMQQLGIYEDFVTYMDSQHEYDKEQKALESTKQEAYQLALAENSELVYEDWLASYPELMPVHQEPVPSEALQTFYNEYK